MKSVSYLKALDEGRTSHCWPITMMTVSWAFPSATVMTSTVAEKILTVSFNNMRRVLRYVM